MSKLDYSITSTSNPPRRHPVVLQVIPALFTGGVERGTVDIAAAISSAGWTSLVASSGGPMVRDIERAGATHITLPMHSKNPMVMLYNVQKMASLIRTQDVDIVHASSRAPAWCARAAVSLTGKRLVTGFHGAYGASNSAKLWYNNIMAKGDRVIAISEFMANYAQRNYKVQDHKLRTVRRGIDLDAYDANLVTSARMIRLAEKWRLPDGMPVVMLPGRMARWKGHKVLIDAIAQLSIPNLRCLLVGASAKDRRYSSELKRHIVTRGVDSQVAVIDQCDDMAAAYMMADVVVSASVEPEAFGRIAAEAQAMGRPVIATDHGGARETVLPGRTGWLVPPNNPPALAKALKEALALDATARSDIAANARAHIEMNFSISQMCSSTLDVYRELL